jgi:endonuclease-3
MLTRRHRYLKQTAVILRDKFDSDIPPTIAGLTSLPGVGPKMAHLCMSAEAGWNRVEGIGVDVHVHRITNLWGWQSPPSKTPEETRMALQSWLPKDRWKEINWLLVGLGQSVCLPIGRKCGDCELGLRGLCKSAEKKKVTEGKRRREVLKVEKAEEDEDGEETVVKMKVEREVDQVVVKEEVVNEEVPDGVIADEQVELGGVKKEEAPELAPTPMKVEDGGDGEVLMSIETDDVKVEARREPSVVKEEKVEGSDVEEVPVNQVPVKQESIKQEAMEQDRRARRIPSRVVKTEAKEEEAGIQDPVKQETPSRRTTSRIVKTEGEREDEEMLDIEPIKNEEPGIDVQHWQQGEDVQPIKKEEPV